MSKRKKIFTVVTAAFTALVILTVAIVGGIFGLFNKGNSLKYSPEQSTQTDSMLYGKRIIFLGSSVTYGYGALGDSFVDYLEYQDGIIPIKEAKSGTTLVDNGKNSYISRMKAIDTATAVDAFVCQLSTNDATKKKPLGKISDSYSLDDFDTKTVIGAVEYIICYAKFTWNCPVIFYTNVKYDSDNYAKMVDALNELKSKWNIDVIDLWNNKSMQNISDNDRKTYMIDEIHPTRRGYREWWTPVIRRQLEKYIN